jgi:hypothetical protein
MTVARNSAHPWRACAVGNHHRIRPELCVWLTLFRPTPVSHEPYKQNDAILEHQGFVIHEENSCFIDLVSKFAPLEWFLWDESVTATVVDTCQPRG